MSKAKKTAELLRARINCGDYLLTDVPVERALAEEVGVSRLTARKALLMMIEEGLLQRTPSGKVVCASTDKGDRVRQIAFLSPAFSSWNFDWWRFAIERCASRSNIAIRPVDYVHWNDLVVARTIERFDGVFLWPFMGEIPDNVLKIIRESEKPVALLESNGRELGIPSMQMLPPESIQLLLELLASKGHKQIDVLSAQNFDPIIEARIQQWSLWRSLHGIDGEFHNYPVKPYESTVSGGYNAMCKLVAEGRFKAKALLCTSEPAAIGAMRAMRDVGIRPGEDVAICAAKDEGMCRYVSPSLTVLECPKPDQYINLILDWMLSDKREWIGSLNLSPAQFQLFEGESTDFELKVKHTSKSS
ncbi:substrate-binding domain-containing protein [Puniceicoccus vermicola]|uniref:Substrate-binding domain-containing protein n=1 Tax=Puniceicoccus vermicola TaxID=388746 RepID=A0A7X1B1M1_9BACT|nr:substrate-binding domain-containing protein [Puniceicoccus vermicola]MBC2603970.1 substrate-binding domain-containing protein [Puniceicoccus vermicola]